MMNKIGGARDIPEHAHAKVPKDETLLPGACRAVVPRATMIIAAPYCQYTARPSSEPLVIRRGSAKERYGRFVANAIIAACCRGRRNELVLTRGNRAMPIAHNTILSLGAERSGKQPPCPRVSDASADAPG
jgi:hypothetical protein